ncbi:hypothetical protein DICPUDRAFT_36498 [Dictyostelium purpureum]|uniref:rRNA-processing protein FYV7 n=1 Tax=Dictyostelium purpureum TaxID=5786 RepID=F0ZR47_DICPU|nr:uncharacterized protein DICPUDRAFT_36498 [Dictyostelium purpureum]EGC33572.1 hypothetical protein DICPUDRAFT_36498 [Dictyostelium purpureum]|eukprot:XP_003289887.1 hypothetical protein DICPUDRAFT_36498 [Dictyostelium purpureum]
MSNKDKKKIFAQRARIGQNQSEDRDRLSIGRFADRNKVYVSKKKIELHKKEKEFKSKYERSKQINRDDNKAVADIYSQYQNNDPLSRFATGDNKKYSELSRKSIRENKKNKKGDDYDQDTNDNDNENENEYSNKINNKKENNKNNNNNNSNNKNDKNIDNKNENKKDGEEAMDERETNFSVQKQFQLAKQQYLKEKKEREEMFKQIEEKKEQTKKHIQQKKKEKFAVILKKTKKGQPIMSNQINKLLSKLQKEENN